MLFIFKHHFIKKTRTILNKNIKRPMVNYGLAINNKKNRITADKSGKLIFNSHREKRDLKLTNARH
ncbi:hypothetical protein CSQ88_17530 [Iodobacter sp. BJB302]|nr:hypothetical protein CSQ88_17530 [Iodobacter sp. BJB302]